MPIYDFIDTETGEQFSKFLKISAKEQYLQENPNVKQQILSAPKLARGTVGLKNDAGWNENLNRIAEAHPNSALAAKVKQGKSSREVEVDKVANKRGMRDKGYNMDL